MKGVHWRGKSIIMAHHSVSSYSREGSVKDRTFYTKKKQIFPQPIQERLCVQFERLNFSESSDLSSKSPAGLNIREILRFQFHFDQGDRRLFEIVMH